MPVETDSKWGNANMNRHTETQKQRAINTYRKTQREIVNTIFTIGGPRTHTESNGFPSIPDM